MDDGGNFWCLEMWDGKGGDRAAEAEAEEDIHRGGFQWEGY